jgi:hypothetical protein
MDEMKLRTNTAAYPADRRNDEKAAAYPADLRSSSTIYLAPAFGTGVIFGARGSGRNSTKG